MNLRTIKALVRELHPHAVAERMCRRVRILTAPGRGPLAGGRNAYEAWRKALVRIIREG